MDIMTAQSHPVTPDAAHVQIAPDVIHPALTYKQALTQAMTRLGADPLRRFIGYGLAGKPPRGALGTLAGVSPEQIVETPVAENLMVGLATGLACAGFKPVVYFERMDFMLNAADAIVNHLAKLPQISRGRYRPGVIIRATIGNRNKPLFTGPTHTQDFSTAFVRMLGDDWRIVTPLSPEGVLTEYRDADIEADLGRCSLICEYKDLL